MWISGERWGIVPLQHKSLVMSRFAKVGKSIFSVHRKNKGGEYPYRITPPHAVGFVLRSWVAPLRCPLSYTGAKICIFCDITKTFWEKVAKNGKVSHEVGQKKGETSRFPPIHTYDRCRLRRPKQFRFGVKNLRQFQFRMLQPHQFVFLR